MECTGVLWRSSREAVGLWLSVSHRDSSRPHSIPLGISCFATIQSKRVLPGFSGAGVWYQNSTKREIWAANPVLAGVQKEWHRESNLMISIRSEVVRHFLEESLG